MSFSSPVCVCPCVLDPPPPRSHQEVIWSQVPPQHLAWSWPNKGELRFRCVVVIVFISGPKSGQQECLFPYWPLRTSCVTSHAPEGCPTPPVTYEDVGRDRQSDSAKALQQHQTWTQVSTQKLLPINNFNWTFYLEVIRDSGEVGIECTERPLHPFTWVSSGVTSHTITEKITAKKLEFPPSAVYSDFTRLTGTHCVWD